jgi:hypothetical protein
VYCATITISGNAVHHNSHQGILFEISTGASITGNAVWENGWSFTAWGWGGGIVVSSSAGADVSGNTVAWNADGIVVLSQNRAGSPAATNNHVHNNVVAIAPQPGDGDDAYAIAWLADWSSPMFDADAGNAGADNEVGLVDVRSDRPFGWSGQDLADPAIFAQTPGGAGLRLLDLSQTRDRLRSAGVPVDPTPTVAHRAPAGRDVLRAGLVVLSVAGLGALLFVVAMLLRRRRGTRKGATPPA